MRALSILATAVSLAVVPRIAVARDQPLSPPIACANGLIGSINCIPTKGDLKSSREAFERGLKLHKRERMEEAFEQFDEAARLNPQNIDYLRAREGLRAKLVFDHIQRGNVLMLQDARLRAAAEFRAAIDLDGNNQFAQERLEEATRVSNPVLNKMVPAPLPESTEIHLDPVESRATFHFTGDSRSLFTQLASAYSVKVQFDDTVQPRQVAFNVDDVDFFTALNLACKVSKMMWAALDTHQVLIAADNPANHKQYDRMLLQTFILPAHSTPQEATD